MGKADVRVPRVKGTGLWVLMVAILVAVIVLAVASQRW
jgi:hypothetical protein